MHHQISFTEQEGGKWKASCCGPEGIFHSKQDAQDYMDFHAGKLGIAFGVNTVGWSEKALPKTEETPVAPEPVTDPVPAEPAPDEVKETVADA